MAGGHIGSALRRLRGLLGAQCAGGPTDGELLRRYVALSDEAAFEALLRRHGPMVLGLCRRLLGTAQDVDDAFQATFLVLIRKAASIGDGDRVGNWLYGVAYRVAVRARSRAARERARQKPLTDVASGDDASEAVPRDVLALLDEEVSRLPARYREAVVCCYLEGRTQEEAAHVLGWPKGTVSTRLNRARELLRARLTRRGLTMTAGSVLLLFGQTSAEGAVPPRLVGAVLGALRQTFTGGLLPAGAAALADAVMKGALVGRVRDGVAVALALAVVTVGHVVIPRPGQDGTSRDRTPAVARVTTTAATARRPAASPPATEDNPGTVFAYEPGTSSRPRPGAAFAGAETEVHVFTLTITRTKGHAPPRWSGDLAKDRVHTSLKVTAGKGWQVARLPSGRTLVAANGTDGQVVALIFLPDGVTPCDEDDLPHTAEVPIGKVWRCWQVSPSGTWSEVEVLREKPQA